MGLVFRRTYRGANGQVHTCDTWTLRFYRNGERIEVSSGTTKKKVAEEQLKQLEGDASHGMPVSAQAQRLTFEEAVAAVVTDYTVNGKRSVTDVEQRIATHLTPYFGGRKMVQITTTGIRAYTAQRLAAGARPGTVNRELSILRRAFSLAHKDGRLAHRPYVPMLEEDNVRKGFFEAAQVEAVKDHLPASLQPLVTFLYLTGWRTGEALALTWGQVDLKAGVVRLDPGQTKNRDGRVFVFSEVPALTTMLEAQRQATEALQRRTKTIIPQVFHRHGKPIKSFRKAWQEACKAAGCPGRIPHDLRRSAVRNLVRSGVSQHTAMKITGHRTDAVFRRYDIVNEEDLKEAGRRVATFLTGTDR